MLGCSCRDFEKLREKLQQVDIVNMAHLGARAFEEIGGEVVQTTSFVIQKHCTNKYRGTYSRLLDATSQVEKEKIFLSVKKQILHCKRSL